MKSCKKILIAFLLNAFFSIFEFIGGLFTNSVSIISDSIHDIGDAISIGVSYFLELKSKKKPNKKYTYGYLRYSTLGALITNTILIIGSIFAIFKSIIRLFNPVSINYNGMIVFAIIGFIINFFAAYFTHEGGSLNQKSINLHMLEDVLGWLVVLIGAIIMRFTDISIIDSIMSIGVALFILINAIKNMMEISNLFLEKTPNNISIDKIKKELKDIEEVIDIHHIHVWSIDGENNYATMHVVVNKITAKIKNTIKEKLLDLDIEHVTLELETKDEKCNEKDCNIKFFHCHH